MQDQLEEVNGRYSLSARVLCRIIEDEAVLLDLDSGQYYGLNSVGTRIYQLFGAGHSVTSIRDSLIQEFEVSQEAADADLEGFIEMLLEKRLLVHRGEPCGAD